MPNNPYQNAVYIQSGSPETENRAQSTGYLGQIGSRLTVKDPPGGAESAQVARTYQQIIVDSALDVAVTEGATLYWRRATGYVVTTDVSVAGRGNVAGVARCAIDVDNIGFIQLEGPCDSINLQTGTPSDQGQEIIPSATDGKADVMTAGTAATYPVMGRTTSTADAGVFAGNLTLPGRP